MAKKQQTFPAVIIDPPLRGYSVERYYPTMTNEEILDWASKVKEFLAPDALIFLWVPNNNIIFGSRILEELGSRWSTMLTWVKPRMGRGRPLRSSTEQVLVAQIGKPVVKFRGQGTWMFAPVQDPSHKPEELHAVIARLIDGPYLELFARRPYPGWHVWGNQLAKSDISIPGYPVPGEQGSELEGVA